jgi:DNA-directed RNA polymerase specialized sigma24 family protein
VVLSGGISMFVQASGVTSRQKNGFPPKILLNTNPLNIVSQTTSLNPVTRWNLKEMVNAALATLTDTLRIPLVLNVYSDLDVTKIAEILGLPAGTVKSRLFSARMKIKKYLDSVNVDK